MTTKYLRDRLQRNQMIMPWAQGDTISTSDAAAMLQCHRSTVAEMAEEGKLDGYRLRPNRRKSPWRLYRVSVERYAAKLMEAYALESVGADGAGKAAGKKASDGK